jgi:hypothetical protein
MARSALQTSNLTMSNLAASNLRRLPRRGPLLRRPPHNLTHRPYASIVALAAGVGSGLTT